MKALWKVVLLFGGWVVFRFLWVSLADGEFLFLRLPLGAFFVVWAGFVVTGAGRLDMTPRESANPVHDHAALVRRSVRPHELSPRRTSREGIETYLTAIECAEQAEAEIVIRRSLADQQLRAIHWYESEPGDFRYLGINPVDAASGCRVRSEQLLLDAARLEDLLKGGTFSSDPELACQVLADEVSYFKLEETRKLADISHWRDRRGPHGLASTELQSIRRLSAALEQRLIALQP